MQSLEVDSRAFRHALGAVARFAGSFRADALGGRVCVRAVDGALTLTSVGDTPLQLRVPLATLGLASKEQAAVVPAPLLEQLTSRLTHGLLRLDLENTRTVRLRSGAFDVRADMVGELQDKPEDFQLPELPEDSAVTLETAELLRGLQAVLYAASKEAFQAVFRGIHFSYAAAGLRLVATDGYRVSVADLTASIAGAGSVLLHGQHLNDLTRLLSLTKGHVVLGVQDGYAVFRTERWVLWLPLMAGEFPSWERVLPTVARRLTVDVAALELAVKRCAVMTDSAQNHALSIMAAPDRPLELSAEGDYGRVTDWLDGAWDADPFTFRANAQYLLEALAHHAGTLTLGFAAVTGPFLLTSEARGLQDVLVPLRN